MAVMAEVMRNTKAMAQEDEEEEEEGEIKEVWRE